MTPVTAETACASPLTTGPQFNMVLHNGPALAILIKVLEVGKRGVLYDRHGNTFVSNVIL